MSTAPDSTSPTWSASAMSSSPAIRTTTLSVVVSTSTVQVLSVNRVGTLANEELSSICSSEQGLGTALSRCRRFGPYRSGRATSIQQVTLRLKPRPTWQYFLRELRPQLVDGFRSSSSSADLAFFFGLAIGCRVLFDQAEDRLLQQRTNEAGSVLQISVTGVRAPLDAAAKIAEATDGDPAVFTNDPRPGRRERKPARATHRRPCFASATPRRSPCSATPSHFPTAPTAPFRRCSTRPSQSRRRRPPNSSSYSISSPPGHASSATPSRRGNTDATLCRVRGAHPVARPQRAATRTDQPFAQLDYAIYIGDQPTTDHLLSASVRDLPLEGRTAEKVDRVRQQSAAARHDADRKPQR